MLGSRAINKVYVFFKSIVVLVKLLSLRVVDVASFKPLLHIENALSKYLIVLNLGPWLDLPEVSLLPQLLLIVSLILLINHVSPDIDVPIMQYFVVDRSLVNMAGAITRQVVQLVLKRLSAMLMELAHRRSTEHQFPCVLIKLVQVLFVHCMFILKVFMHDLIKVYLRSLLFCRDVLVFTVEILLLKDVSGRVVHRNSRQLDWFELVAVIGRERVSIVLLVSRSAHHLLPRHIRLQTLTVFLISVPCAVRFLFRLLLP